MKSIISKKINIPMNNVGKDLKKNINELVINEYSDKCIKEGYIKPNSIVILTHSCGTILSNQVVFDVVFECEICNPVEGMIINCVALNITNAGIRAESSDYTPSPFVIFIARDHNFNKTQFSSIQEKQNITVRIIGQRFELNDKYISIIAELVNNKPSIINANTINKKTKKNKYSAH
jgi:DNA-directed RNA polymerase subunit E'/Rpb7